MARNNLKINSEADLDKWAESMIDFWIQEMKAQEVGISYKPNGDIRESSKALKQSFTKSVVRQAGGNTAKIDHMFNQYGMYLDGGVFPGRKGSGGENHISNPNRKPKTWRSLKYWYSQRRLQEAIVEFTGRDYLRSISTILSKHNS